ALTSTRLDIDWPAEERKGASLEIDGREPILSAKLSFSGRPGKRRLKITRPGYEPIDEEIALASGATVSYRPEWIPTPQTVRRQPVEARQPHLRHRSQPRRFDHRPRRQFRVSETLECRDRGRTRIGPGQRIGDHVAGVLPRRQFADHRQRRLAGQNLERSRPE